jgi:hypothetical protein
VLKREPIRYSAVGLDPRCAWYALLLCQTSSLALSFDSGVMVMDRRIDVFFYGLFMDADVLRDRTIAPANVRPARVEGFELRVGKRATLVSSDRGQVFGILMALTHLDLKKLYDAAGLEEYRPEAVIAYPLEGKAVPALCYNLPHPPRADERNVEYVVQLQAVATKLGFPPEYIKSIG